LIYFLKKYSPRQFDNFHVLLWLFKDLCWVLEYKICGVIMIIPTFFVAILLLIQSILLKDQIGINLAITFWITANSIWMLDEFYTLNLQFLPPLFFVLGIFAAVSHYILKK
jgi:hypothetical protein